MPRHALTTLLACLLALFAMGQGCPSVPDDDDDNTPPPVDPGDDDTTEKSRHEKIFSEILTTGYQGTEDCLTCHTDRAQDILDKGHWNWEGVSANIEGFENEIHGKTDLINNFCIAVPSNEGRCTQCHIGYGWQNNTFDFEDATKIDCLVCHDQTGTYKKAPKTAGMPEANIDLQAVAESVGPPTRTNCGFCHFNAGGGDNVKHGDLSSDLANPTFQMDVHMNASGLNFACQDCHETARHSIAGFAVHSLDEGRTECTDCHSGSVHDEAVLNLHLNTVACESCHIPAIARSKPTVVEWYWDEAGQDISPIPTDEYGKATYDKMKGRFVWAKNVKPVLKWHNRKWRRAIIGANDTYTTTPVVLADPVGSIDDLSAKIYPFKKMIGRQPADPVNKRLIVPHLFGLAAGQNPYWTKYDWSLAIAEGAAYAGQSYSGTYDFVDTVMYLPVSHEIAPKESALDCEDCHAGGIDFIELGFEGDPWTPTR